MVSRLDLPSCRRSRAYSSSSKRKYLRDIGSLMTEYSRPWYDCRVTCKSGRIRSCTDRLEEETRVEAGEGISYLSSFPSSAWEQVVEDLTVTCQPSSSRSFPAGGAIDSARGDFPLRPAPGTCLRR